MKIAEEVKSRINSFPQGCVFSISDFGLDPKYDIALAKTLSRLASRGELSKVSKGKYYKPKQTMLGQIQPIPEELVKDLLIKDGKRVGYITGIQAFCEMGLTSQVSSTLLIGTQKYRRSIKRGDYTVKFLQQNNPIVSEDIELFRILDAVKMIREIPAVTPNDACRDIISIIRSLDCHKQKRLEYLSLSYTNYVRAVVGAMYESIGLPTDAVRKTLNGVTKYQLPLSGSVLPTKDNWNIYEPSRR